MTQFLTFKNVGKSRGKRSYFDSNYCVAKVQKVIPSVYLCTRGDSNPDSLIMIKAGILGGGQLGRMLLQQSANYPVATYVMDSDPSCPAAHLCHHFQKGDITSFDNVYEFGKGLDIITVEIEKVNVAALEKLEAEGIQVVPRPHVLKTLQNKILQKEFYRDHGILSSEFKVTQNRNEILEHRELLPAVHKAATGGYDGRGVQIIADESHAHLGFEEPAVLEKLVEISREISIIVAVSQSGEFKLFPPVDMIFDPDLNLVSYQLAPAEIPEKTLWKAEALALAVAKAFKSPGLFAVELFIDKKDQVLVNETAPRVHNSGHQSIEGNYCSQFDMLWRILLHYPLGHTDPLMPAAMVNIIGAPGHSGPVHYRGLEEVLKIENAFVHLYGKSETRPGRKMGHVTILSEDKQDLIYKCNLVKRTLFAETK
jgi:5-(carboxyamino)imidazole ribonucleotide synthase